MDPSTAKAHEKLKAIRTRTDLSIRKNAYLKETFTDFDGTEQPLKIRYYQVQGILHMVVMKNFLLGDDTGLGKCVVGDSLVLTRKGLIPIRCLQADPSQKEDTFGPSTDSEVWTGKQWAPVKSFYYAGIKPTLRVTTRGGFEIEGSYRHPLKCRYANGEGFVRLPEIDETHYVAIERRELPFPETEVSIEAPDTKTGKSYNLPTTVTPDLARFMGYYVAEGHSSERGRVIITQHHQESHLDIRTLAFTCFGWKGNDNSLKRDFSIEITSVAIWDFLSACGMGWGLSEEKYIPPSILRSPRPVCREFLRGLFEGDGGVIAGGVEYTTKSERLSKEVQALLLRFGIVAYRKPKVVRGCTYWRLNLFGFDAKLFHERIGFCSTRKVKRLGVEIDRKKNPNHDVVPYAKPLVEALRDRIYSASGMHGYKGEGFCTRWGSAFYNTFGHIRAERRNPSYAFLEKVREVCVELGIWSLEDPACSELEDILNRRWFYDPVATILESQTEVMDIEVDAPEHSFVANGLVNHNTIQSIAALTFLWDKNPDLKVIVLTTKSAAGQWVDEFAKFTNGVSTFLAKGTPKKREKVLDAFEASTGPSVLVMGYATARRDIRRMLDWEGFVLITDEATAYKNEKTQTHQCVRHLAENASRVWALTATLIENHLLEGWGIYRVVVPGLFGTKNWFMNTFCITRMQQLPGSRRRVPVIVGYRPDAVTIFRDQIDPYFLGRPKMEVAKELPPLTRKRITVGMSKAQEVKYDEALSGLLEITRNGETEEKEVTKLTALIYCQQIVNHPDLIGAPGNSEKLDALVDMLTDGDLADEKVIVFTRFRTMVDIIEAELKAKKIGVTRITGAEDEDQRTKNKKLFQDPNSDVKVVCITTAARQGVNLQAAKALVFYDTPWSAGDYLQILGRMIRIGSKHDSVTAIHLVAKDSIDQRVMEVLTKKMKLVEAVLGKRLKGENDSDDMVSPENDISALFEMLQQDARKKLK